MSDKPFTYRHGCVFSSLEDIKNRHITVMGLGLNGGGEACVRFFLKHGAYVTVTDMKTEEQLKPSVDSINSDSTLDLSRLTYRLGEHRIEDFSSADCIIKNPGVKIAGNKFLAAAKAIETDISIFLYFSKAPVIAVTGSKGKSSTVSAIHYGLNKAGFTSFLGGNITVSPLTFLEKTDGTTPVVLELSSWQLADLRGRRVLKPHISVITKIVPDHQNWYGSMENYIADKRLIYADQTAADYSIFDAGGDKPGTGPAAGGTWGNFFASESKAEVLRYGTGELPAGTSGAWLEYGGNDAVCGKVLLKGMSEPEIILKETAVPGKHMQTNALNAALVMYLMGVPADTTAQILSGWQGTEHRIQYFHTWNADGRTLKFYNDSCATVPEAAAAASQAFGTPVILITGGTDKELSFEPLVQTLAARNAGTVPVKSIYLLAGTGTDKLMPLLDEAAIKYRGPFGSLEELLVSLRHDTEADGIAVFSPGATSFGMFSNEFDRGNKFMQKVKEIFK